MSETKFTPGPWEPRIGNGIEVCHDAVAIAEIWVRGDRQTEEANAHLIAAAPDLYEALGNLEPYLDAIVCYASTITEHPQNGFILKARAALAKARGKK